MTEKPRLVGINHVALEVGDLDAALDFYARIFDFELRGRIPGMAFLDMGDQFLALSEGRSAAPDADRHFGLVVDDKEAARERLHAAGVEVFGRGLDFPSPGERFRTDVHAAVGIRPAGEYHDSHGARPS